ncbi:hypothetical protein [Vibrio cholerae]|uniref:hypothetical protein n=1 Tax=Vibrio cholerae TaxID=666 RepID=UPI002160F171|nr:hypothetical protein [Vibrio cholerae]MCS0096655.1 hypothetical protein [Vibrio cholerae]
MSNPNEIELTQVEQNWLDEFTVVMNKMPKALTLRINSFGDGSVEVFSPAGKDFTPAQSRWIKRIESVLESFPKTPEFWTLSNIDGFHVGKGCPSTFSGTSYGVWGATGSSIVTIMMIFTSSHFLLNLGSTLTKTEKITIV